MSVKKLLIGLVFFTSIADAGIIVTIEGRRYEGDLKKTNDGWNVTASDGTVTQVPSNRVKTIELTSSSSIGSMEKLYSLRRSVEAVDDINKIIERYKRFIEQIRDQNTIDEANKDLALWQERLNKSLVKSGKEWITVEQRQERAVESINKIIETRDLIKSGRLVDAGKRLSEIQQIEPGNLSALYLQGVLSMKQEKLGDAKKYFSQVQQSLTDHSPTLMNLAIINARQKQWSLAAGQVELSMVSSPAVQILVDNAAELYNALPDDIKKSAAGQKLSRRFAEQDELLQSRMAEKQLYRWGAKWVDRPTREKLAQAEDEVKKKIDELQVDFDTAQNRISRIDTQISDNLSSMSAMESASYTRLSDGRYIQLPLPSSYYDLERDNSRLKVEKQEKIKYLDSLRDTAKRVRDQLPTPKYSGILHPIEEDGVPIVIPAGVNVDLPTTQPAEKSPPPTTQSEEKMIIKIGPAEEEPAK